MAALSRATWTTSIPVQNALPLAALTITLTSGSVSRSAQAASSSSSISASKALPASGLSRINQPIPSALDTIKRS